MLAGSPSGPPYSVIITRVWPVRVGRPPCLAQARCQKQQTLPVSCLIHELVCLERFPTLIYLSVSDLAAYPQRSKLQQSWHQRPQAVDTNSTSDSIVCTAPGLRHQMTAP